MGEFVDKSTQIEQVSRKLNIPKVTVSSVWDSYVNYLRGKIENGESVKFLNICYLRVGKNSTFFHETLAFVCSEIDKSLKLGRDFIYRILSCYEEYLISDISSFYNYQIRGLVRIRLEKYLNGTRRVRIRKSTVYNGEDIRVVTLNSFKRKVEFG